MLAAPARILEQDPGPALIPLGLDRSDRTGSFHDIGQRCIAGLIEPQVSGHHSRQLQAQSLQAPINLPFHFDLVPFQCHLGGECALWPVQKSSCHLPCLVTIIIDGLLSQQHQVHLLLLCQLGQDPSHLQGTQVIRFCSRHLHVDAPVCTHGQSGADCLLALGRPTADGNDFLHQLLLLESHGLLHGDLTEGVHGMLHAICDHTRLVGLHPDLLSQEEKGQSQQVRRQGLRHQALPRLDGDLVCVC